ncbi:MAG TPA: biotin/lipoyl-containing protein, partial [Pseudolabrys sp.]
ATGYVGAGTVEFIFDATNGLKAGNFWFMEMNTRLQVEHPVTEAVTGIDLVEWQFRIAAGEQLPLAQHQVKLDGHAVEARLYAEDPERGFLPSTGRLIALQLPKADGLRVDTGVEAGSDVTPFYDPMIAKLIAHGTTRDEALDRLSEALDHTIVVGPRNNAGFLAALCRAADFRKGYFDTGFIDRNAKELGAVPQAIDRAATALGVQYLLAQQQPRALTNEADQLASPWDETDAFQLSGERKLQLPVLVEGEGMVAEVGYSARGQTISIDGTAPARDGFVVSDQDAVYVLRLGRQTKVALRDLTLDEAGDQDKSGLVRAPMHGKVLGVLVEIGARVTRGQRVAIIEAMKMEHTLLAPLDGIVADIAVGQDAQIAEGAKIMRIEPTQPAKE